MVNLSTGKSSGEKASRRNWKLSLYDSAPKGPVDYKNIRLSRKQLLAGIAEGLALSMICAFLFYRSVFAMALSFVIIPAVLWRNSVKNKNEVLKRLDTQFCMGMQSAAGSLMAGYSMENALKNAGNDVGRVYGKGSEFYAELTWMSQNISMNVPVEELFEDLADRSGSEDISYFAEVLRYAKRSGGNITAIIKETSDWMQEKSEVMSGVENAVAAKKWEQMIMTILFPGVIFYMTISSPEYAAGLYHNAVGITVMSISLAGYASACIWSERIMDIKV